MKMTKALLASVLVAGFASAAAAHERPVQVQLTGSIDTQLGFRDQENAFDGVGATRLHDYALVNDTSITVKANGHAKHGFKYGAEIELNADTSENKYAARGSNSRQETGTDVARRTMMYVDSSMGRLEAGSTHGSYEAMRVGTSRISQATGGVHGDWKYWPNTTFGTGSFIVNGALPTAMIDNDVVANAAKVNYFSPTYSGFKAGVTFIPDTEQHGTVTLTKTVSRNTTASTTKEGLRTSGFKNVFQGGLMYHGKWDATHLRFSALGEMGDAKDHTYLTGKRHDLRAWELAASMHYKGFGVAGSYGDWGKSGLDKTVANVATTGKKTGQYWTAGASYEHGNIGASFSYLGSKTGGFGESGAVYSQRKGHTDAYSFGVDYKLAPGFMPYAEVTHFNMKDKSATPATKNDGNIVLVGTKLNF